MSSIWILTAVVYLTGGAVFLSVYVRAFEPDRDELRKIFGLVVLTWVFFAAAHAGLMAYRVVTRKAIAFMYDYKHASTANRKTKYAVDRGPNTPVD